MQSHDGGRGERRGDRLGEGLEVVRTVKSCSMGPFASVEKLKKRTENSHRKAV